MSGPSTTSPTNTKSRRALLAGAVGGLGAWAASAIGRASAVRAEGEAIVVGGEYATAQSVTQLTNAANNADVFKAITAGSGIGVYGNSQQGYGVRGHSQNTFGVYGDSNDSAGVYGISSTQMGVWGDSTSSTGVRGSSGSSTGVHGNSNSGVGVRGTSNSVQGVVGQGAIGVEGTSNNQFAWGVGGSNTADGGIGVWASAQGAGSRGVSAHSTGGVGVYAEAPGGLALRAVGRARFSTSGVATIPAGSTSVTVTPNVNVVSSSFVLLTPKVNIGSRALWFTTNATTNKFTIRMSSARSSGTKVAWLLLG